MNILINDIVEQLPGYIGWKDKNFIFLGCNYNNARFLKIKHVQDIIGMRDIDFLDRGEANFHKEHDLKVLTGHTVKTLHASLLSKKQITYFQIKKPLLQNNKITGIIYHCIEFIHPKLFPILHDIDKRYLPINLLPICYEIEPENNKFGLSSRELECLFCILRGMSASQIGKFLCLSKRTIEFYTENIKNKFKCHTKAELIDFGINQGYFCLIPSAFLQNPFMNIITATI